MEKIQGITIPFYRFRAEEELANSIMSEVKNLEFRAEAKTENGYVCLDYYNKDLFEFFHKSIREFKKNYFQDNIEFPIVDCWVNKYTKLNKLHRHNHSNSIICGLYYVSDHIDCGSTIFEYKNPWIFSNPEDNLLLSVNIKNEFLAGEIYPESGTLILFPPSLFHYMKPLKSNFTRYTIAFNTFASGKISSRPSSFLQVQVLSLEERLGIK